MRVDLNKQLENKVTIINRLDARDSVTRRDVWYKTVLEDVQWSVKRVVSQEGNVTNIGRIVRIQIPHTDDYKIYREWVKDADKSWTASLNDRVVLGEVVEAVTTETIHDVLRLYEPQVCTIQVIKDLRANGAISSSNKGASKWLEVIYLEGS